MWVMNGYCLPMHSVSVEAITFCSWFRDSIQLVSPTFLRIPKLFLMHASKETSSYCRAPLMTAKK